MFDILAIGIYFLPLACAVFFLVTFNMPMFLLSVIACYAMKKMGE